MNKAVISKQRDTKAAVIQILTVISRFRLGVYERTKAVMMLLSSPAMLNEMPIQSVSELFTGEISSPHTVRYVH